MCLSNFAIVCLKSVCGLCAFSPPFHAAANIERRLDWKMEQVQLQRDNCDGSWKSSFSLREDLSMQCSVKAVFPKVGAPPPPWGAQSHV